MLSAASKLLRGASAGAAFAIARRSPTKLHAARLSPLLPLRARRQLSTKPADDDDIDVDAVSYGFMASQAIFAGLELGVFDAIGAAGDAGLSLEALQRSCGVSAPRLQTLLTSLVAIKALRRDGASGAYTNSPNAGAFLVQASRHYYGDYLRYQMGRQFYHRMGELPDVMRTGQAPSYADWFSDPATAQTYTQARAQRRQPQQP